MNAPMPNPLSFDAKTKILLLRTLYFLTLQGEYPTATELVMAIDARDRIPRGTASARRALIRGMRDAGLISPVVVPDSKHERLGITKNGVKLIQYIDAEGRK